MIYLGIYFVIFTLQSCPCLPTRLPLGAGHPYTQTYGCASLYQAHPYIGCRDAPRSTTRARRIPTPDVGMRRRIPTPGVWMRRRIPTPRCMEAPAHPYTRCRGGAGASIHLGAGWGDLVRTVKAKVGVK